MLNLESLLWHAVHRNHSSSKACTPCEQIEQVLEAYAPSLCGFMECWVGKCKNIVPCDKHKDKKCGECGEPATSNCEQTMGPLVCGVNMCDKHQSHDNHWTKRI